MPKDLRVVALLLIILGAVSVTSRADPAPVLRNGLGIMASGRGAWESLESPSAENPLYLHWTVDIQEDQGWLTEPLQLARTQDIEPIINFRDPSLTRILANGEPVDLQPWISALETFISRHGKLIRYYQLLDRPSERFSPKGYAFFVKQMAVLIRSLDEDAQIVEGALGSNASAWQKELYGYDIAPYFDVLAAYAEDSPLPSLLDFKAQHHPRAKLMLQRIDLGPQAQISDLIQTHLALLTQGADLLLYRFYPTFDFQRLKDLRRVLSINRAHVPDSRIIYRTVDGEPVQPATSLEFFDDEEKSTIVAIAGGERYGGDTIEVTVPIASIRSPEIIDLIAGEQQSLEFFLPDQKSATTSLDIILGEDVLFLYFQWKAGPLIQLDTTVRVTGKRELSIGEVISRHRRAKAYQDRILDHYSAQSIISFHFRIADLNQTFDVTTVNNFYADRERTEWEILEFYLNGSRWWGRKPPKLPFIQPEKVREVPLDISLDKNYEYRLKGTEKVRGFHTYVVDFHPVSQAASLFSGQVWIDSVSFNKVKVSVVQTNLKKPIVSNHLVQHYEPIVHQEQSYWLLTRVTGEMIFSTVGTSTVVERDLSYRDLQINDPSYWERKERAHQSDHRMIADTEEGYRYLEKRGEERVLEEEVSRRNISFLTGGLYDESLDNPVPFIGINYFNFNFADRGIQANLFFAGALLNITITDPNLLRSPVEFSLNGAGRAFKRDDQKITLQGELEDEEVERRSQSLALSLGLPFLNYFKIWGRYGLFYDQFDEGDETRSNFIIPDDTFTQSGAIGLDLDWLGFSVDLWGEASERNDWTLWGNSSGSDFDPAHESYEKYGLRLSKAFFLPKFQKISLGVAGFDSSDTDRFSKFNFQTLGDSRVRGFGGSGIRFEEGVTGQLGYSFNLAELLRFDVTFDYASIKNREDFGSDSQDLLGVGVEGNFVAPFNSFVRFDIGYGIESDIRGTNGEFEYRLFLLHTLQK